MLETSEASANSALQRARTALEGRMPPKRERALLPDSPRERELAANFADALERADWDQLIPLLTEDAWITMPPEPFEYQGRETIASFLHHVTARRRIGGITRLLPTRANGQPAFGHYMASPGVETATGTGLFVLTLDGDQISMITRFGGADLLPRFGLPASVQL
jgi:RNA polymerase sigma-70 factor (ECF subfamily)